MNYDESSEGVSLAKSVPVPTGMGLWAVRSRIGDDEWAVRVEMAAGKRSAPPLLFTGRMGADDARLIAATAKRLADIACGDGGSGGPPSPPIAGDGEDDRLEPRPKWLCEARFIVDAVCGQSQLRAARMLANTLLADVEADELPLDSTWSTADSVRLQWRNGDRRIQVAVDGSGLYYTIIPAGFSGHSAPFRVNAGVARIGGRPIACSRPDHLRLWLGKLFDDHETIDYGWDADVAMEVSGWWEQDEIDAICGVDELGDEERWVA